MFLHSFINSKRQSSPITHLRRRRGERTYSSYSFTTSALDGVSGVSHASGRALPPGRGPPVHIGQEDGWAPEPIWTHRIEEKIPSPLPGIEPGSPGRAVRSQTLYCLSYPSPFINSSSGNNNNNNNNNNMTTILYIQTFTTLGTSHATAKN
jgi:hypothetical protein